MTRFCLDSDDLFLFVNSGTNEIRVFKSDKIGQPVIHSNEWTTLKTLNPDKGDQLELFNCVIQGPEFKQLIREIEQPKWVVNREGCIYMYAPDIKCSFRINDFFGWSKYGVHLSRHTVWNKLELNTKEVVVDITEKDKSLTNYTQQLEKKEQELSSYKEQLEKMQKEKQSVSQKILKELEADKEEELSFYKKLLKEKEKELSYLEIRIAKKEKEFNSMENEFSQFKKSLEQKVGDLNAAKIELEINRREVTVWVTLLEKQLKLESLWRGKQEDDCKKIQEELSLHKKKLEMIEKQLNEVSYKLIIEQKKVNVFRAALKCLVTFLEDHNTCLGKDFNYEIMLPTLRDAKHANALKGLREGVTVSKISSTILQIVEQQNYAEA